MIGETHAYGREDLEQIDNYEEDAIRELLLGHRVAKVADDHLRLDDGTLLKIVGNEGCGGCSSGWYELTDLNDCDNIVTAVEFAERSVDPDNEWSDAVYEVFVLAEDQRINLFAVEGTDGNGYYGTGYRILVRRPS